MESLCNISAVSLTLETNTGTKTSADHAVTCLCRKQLGRDIRNFLQWSKTEDYFSANLNCSNTNMRDWSNPVFKQAHKCIPSSRQHIDVCLCPAVLLQIGKKPTTLLASHPDKTQQDFDWSEPVSFLLLVGMWGSRMGNCQQTLPITCRKLLSCSHPTWFNF